MPYINTPKAIYKKNLFKGSQMIIDMSSPKHIAIIMDGNRRFAQKKGLIKIKGHIRGAKKIETILNWCKEFNIKELTLYAFSLQNFNRDPKEKQQLFDLFEKYFGELVDEKELPIKQTKVRFVGDIKLFPKKMQEIMNKLEKKTSKYNKFLLNFCMAYGGREEIVNSINEAIGKSQSKKAITLQDISKNLWLKSEPELIIRTSGEQRTSNFLMWQSWYSEWFFTKQMWPEFSKKEFKKALASFSRRERRYGK